jgi:phosphatidylethanolamine-binding protein (PEBP) family uncharacterized protein
MRLSRGGFIGVGIAVTLVIAGTLAAQEGPKGGARPAVPSPIKITIPAFPDGGVIPVKYANSTAGSTSPAIEWSGVPAGTVTLALIVHDADVPTRLTGSTSAGAGPDDTLHWAIFNIPATATGLPEGVPHNLTLEDGCSTATSGGGPAGLAPPKAPTTKLSLRMQLMSGLSGLLCRRPDAQKIAAP